MESPPAAIRSRTLPRSLRRSRAGLLRPPPTPQSPTGRAATTAARFATGLFALALAVMLPTAVDAAIWYATPSGYTISSTNLEEGEEQTVTITLASRDISAPEVLRVWTQIRTSGPYVAAGSGDYTSLNTTLTFDGKGDSHQVTVTSAEDDLVEHDERYRLNIQPTAGSWRNRVDWVYIKIRNDDRATMTVSDASRAEGEELTFTVTLDKKVQDGVTVTPTFTHGTVDGTDYTASATALTFAGTAGEKKTFTVSTTDDAKAEGDETFTVGLTLHPGPRNSAWYYRYYTRYGASILVDTGTGTILNDDPPRVGSHAFELEENRAGPVTLGAVAAVDPDAATYALTAGDTARFAIDPTSGELAYVGAGEDFEATTAAYRLTVTATDRGGLTATAAVTVEITNVNEAPVPVGEMPPQMLLQAASRTIDSAPYFRDPDGDPLDYEATTADSGVVTARTSSPPVTMTGAGLGQTEVVVTVRDPDGKTARQVIPVAVVEWAIFVPPALKVTEGDSATYGVKLRIPPRPAAEAVTVALASGDAQAAVVSPSSLTFTSDDWNRLQTVTVTGVEDDDTAAETVAIVHTASGGGYDSMTAQFEVTVVDDDTQGVTIAPAEVTVDEGASLADAYTVVLDTLPTGEVTVTPASDDARAAAVTPARLTFTPDNWNLPQSVDVAGVTDDDADHETVTVRHAVAGADYAGVDAGQVTVRVTDTEGAARERVAQAWLSRFGPTRWTRSANA